MLAPHSQRCQVSGEPLLQKVRTLHNHGCPRDALTPSKVETRSALPQRRHGRVIFCRGHRLAGGWWQGVLDYWPAMAGQRVLEQVMEGWMAVRQVPSDVRPIY